MDHEKCYVFTKERPAKRRRVENPQGLDASLPLRVQLYRDAWAEQQQRITNVLKSANESTLDAISSFLRDCRHHTASESLPSGFVLAGPSVAAHSLIFDQLRERTLNERTSIFITISSSDSQNLKTLLKTIIKSGTSSKSHDDDELELAPSKRSGRKLLDYDLQLLRDHIEDNGVEQVVIAFRDCEAFDSAVLSESIELLSIWSDRIPFVLLFGIATSIENLQDRLSQTAAACLAGNQFDVIQSDDIVERIFAQATIYSGCRIRIGAQLGNMLLQRQHENLLGAQDLVDAIQYAYMTHFFANPLSVFMSESVGLENITTEHCEAFRNAPSFRRFAEDSLKKANDARNLRTLLSSDQTLFDRAKIAIRDIEEALAYLSEAVQVIHAIMARISKTKAPLTASYTKAMAGNLHEDPTVRELLLAVKKLPSDILLQVLQTIKGMFSGTVDGDIDELRHQLETLASESTSDQPMRSEHDIRNDTVRTTVVAQKVQLSRHKSKLSEKDEAYSKIVTDFHGLLAAAINDVQNPQDMLGYEAVVYDIRMPHRAALGPKPRFAIERALKSPHDYLNCQCCGSSASSGINGEDANISATLPATALLYRLYLESGALINATDLWSAFAAIMEGEGEDSSAQMMPLFERALAELKYLGLVKSTRKKTDHIAKIAWEGL